ncbi:nucleotidyltransferase domain-containing protein [Oceanobacillus piezotolerans]|uniref:Nucleotidyltransferase domain-containing protein n=1 Tax=Oceanobacillus piezotolerans TaxID=2448030 RepID=A0A498D628_9BACI|nr:nucleotidyltransferase domain-containing protein [Oceanobacillus piezotolerans]RLL45119.1 nucleotidyltransferase domain-containing protein [Oceanobacillus piezotolerans]
MKKIILNTLNRIELDYGIKILYSCEVGSRAFGLASQHSDYDVRFIYVHKTLHYLEIDPIGIGKKKDYIDVPVQGNLDIHGWELTKALKLFRKSNPSLLEWLHSSIIYLEPFTTIQQLKAIQNEAVELKSCMYHYLNMAKNNLSKLSYMESENVKDYLNVARPILFCKWIENHLSFPPTLDMNLLVNILPEGNWKEHCLEVITLKRKGIPLLQKVQSNLFKEELYRLDDIANSLPSRKSDPTKALNLLFQTTLEEVWSKEKP